MTDKVADLLRQAVVEASRAAVDAAREEGFALGVAEGRRRALGAMRSLVNQWLVDVAAGRVGDDLVLGNAEGPGSVVALEERMQEIPSPVAAAKAPGSGSAETAVETAPVREAAAGSPPAAAEPVHVPGAWKTAEREAHVRARWPVAGVTQKQIYAEIAAMPGPPVPPEPANLRDWANRLKLGPRPIAGVQPEEHPLPSAPPVQSAPQAAVRETEALKRGRELLGMGLHINDVRQAVKLTAAELQVLTNESRVAA